MTNLLLGYPDIPFSSSVLASPSGASALWVINGGRTYHFTRATAGTSSTWDFDLGSGNTATPAYLYVARADLIRKRDSAASTWTLTGSASSSFTSPDTETGTFNTADLVGPRQEDLLLTSLSYSTAYRYWRFTVTTTASFQHKFSKVYFGAWFDFGREPVAPLRIDRQVITPGARELPNRFRLIWRGISDGTLNSLSSKILAHADLNPVILYDPTELVLPGFTVMHARIVQSAIAPESMNSNRVELELEELI